MEKLGIYRESYKLVSLIYRCQNEMPRKDRFSIGTRMIDSGLDMLDHITVAYLTKVKVDRLKSLGDFFKSFTRLQTYIKQGRIYVHNRTVNNAFLAVERFNKITPTVDTLEDFRSTINSYLGFMKNRATFNIRKRLVESISEKWKEYITIPEDYSKVVIKDKYIKHNVIKKQLKIQKLCYKKELMKATG